MFKTKILSFIFFITVQFLILGFSEAKPTDGDPIKKSDRYVEVGTASWYGPGFHGKKTANGEIFDTYSFTAAHKYLPFNTLLKVTNLSNEKYVVVRINDRGPFGKGRIIDLSKTSKTQIGMDGLAKVKIEEITEEEAESLRNGIDPFEVVDEPEIDSSKYATFSLLDTKLNGDSKVILSFTSENGETNDFSMDKNVVTSGNLKVKIITPKTNEENKNSNLYKSIDNIDPLIRFFDLSNQLTVINGYMIEVNTFNDKSLADRFIGRLDRDGFKTIYLEEILSNDPVENKQIAQYKVLVGLYNVERSANKDLNLLKKLNYQPKVVKVGD
ncbi:MAG TPA: septal ring lytic transglycosylase RlpA family protein [Ignavibacteria bacterium]